MFFYLQGIADLRFVIDFLRVWILSGSFILKKKKKNWKSNWAKNGFFFFF